MSKTREKASWEHTISSSAPSNPRVGDMYYDTNDNITYVYSNTQWVSITNSFSAEGGTITTDGNFKIHTFTSSGTFIVNSGTTSAEILIVAGGGGGGADNAGGGGAGGLLYYGPETPKTPNGAAYTISIPGNYSVIVGAGGSGHTGNSDGTSPAAVNGSNSSIFGYTAIGGGRGCSSDTNAGAPGSGGSGGGTTGNGENAAGGAGNQGSGTSGQGNAGGSSSNGGGGGGGGGAGSAGGAGSGSTGGAGGNGLQYSISGSALWYAAGGNGGNENDTNQSRARTNGIGGQTNSSSGGSCTSGVTNTGSGGGGGTHTSVIPTGAGASGIVIIRYIT